MFQPILLMNQEQISFFKLYKLLQRHMAVAPEVLGTRVLVWYWTGTGIPYRVLTTCSQVLRSSASLMTSRPTP